MACCGQMSRSWRGRQGEAVRTPWLRALWVAPVLLLAACADPSGIAPRASLVSPESLGLTHTDTLGVAPSWWTQYGDAQLNALIAQALRDNPSLQVAQARVRRAQAQIQAAQAARTPQVQAQTDVTRQHYTATGLVPAPVAGSVVEAGTAQLGTSWEPDIFGRQRAALDAAIGAARAVQADARAARIMLATQIVRQYIALARLQAQQRVVRRTYAQRTEVLTLVRARLHAGLDTELELRQSEGLLPQARQQLLVLQEQMDLVRNAMAALVGKPIHADDIAPAPLEQLSHIPLPQVLPLDLLGRRADIVAARWRVHAMEHGIAQTQALFYPNVNLLSFLGLNSLGLNRLLQSDSRQWGLGAAISLPLFDAGRLRANLATRTADYDEAAEQYNALVIQAVREVADALMSLRALDAQQAEQAQALAATENAYQIAHARYEAGLANYLQVLSAESAVLRERLQTLDLTARVLDVQAQLAQALGGGYQADAGPQVQDESFQSMVVSP